jgi:hypothetical protein
MSTTSTPRPCNSSPPTTNRLARDTSVALGRYTSPQGYERELVCQPGFHGSVLVIDRFTASHEDARLVAHLASDEPAQNAQIIGSLYLNDERGRRCRRLTRHDLQTPPPTEEAPLPTAQQQPDTSRLTDEHGFTYRLLPVDVGRSIPQLRWWRNPAGSTHSTSEAVSVREAIGSLESYAPVLDITAQALTSHSCDPAISTLTLRTELERVHASPVVLNRALREAVLAAVKHGASMSEIAIRCGRVKRDARGNTSGETSWLARRIGQLPDSAESTPTPWIHSRTLALIAWQGLGIAPREVELG